MVGTQGHRRHALGQRKVGALAVPEKGLGQRERGDEGGDPVRRPVAWSLEAVAFPDQGEELGDETLLVEVPPGRLRQHRQIENRPIDVADQTRLRQLRAQQVAPERRRPVGEPGGVLRQQGVASALVEPALVARREGQRDAGLLEEAEQGRPPAVHAPGDAGDAVLRQQLESRFAVGAAALQPVFRKRQPHDEALALPLFRRQRIERSMDAVLDPDLSVAPSGVVLQDLEGRRLHRLKMVPQRGQQPQELRLLVEPQADPRALLVLEALPELVDERRQNHHTTFALRSTPAFCSGAMLTLTPSSTSGSQPVGLSSADFHGVRMR